MVLLMKIVNAIRGNPCSPEFGMIKKISDSNKKISIKYNITDKFYLL